MNYDRIEMKATYSGYEIAWNDYNRTFVIKKDDIELRRDFADIAEARKWIDNQGKQKFKRVPVLCRFGFRDELEHGEATSIINGDEVWCISASGKRNKIHIGNVWMDTPGNKKILADIHELNQVVVDAANKISELEKKAQRITAEDMVEKT